MNGFLDRLKQRKIVQWTLAYLAGAFALLQAVDLVGQHFGWPEQVMRLLIVTLAIGFFVALVLAWYHGERGAQRIAGTELVVLALLFAIGGGILWRVASAPRTATMRTESATASLGPASTAVLPFVNMSADKANEYFSDGMTETLLNRLAQVPQLKVAARTSSFSFKGTNTDVRTIGAALGVASIVEGSVQQAGDTLRITAQLIRAGDGSHLWSHNYDRKATDLFAIQDEIAGAVTEALVGELLPKTKAILAKNGTKSLAAYDAYTRGLQQLAISRFDAYQKSEALMRQALAIDPDYVEAMIGLVDTWLDMARTGQIADAEFHTRAIPLLDRIEALDPGNAWLLAYRGEIAQKRGEHALAVQLAQRAVAAAPGVSRVHNLLADIYNDQDNAAAALPEMDQALALNPLDANVARFRAVTLRHAGRIDEAKQATLHAMQLDPHGASNFWERSVEEYALGNFADAVVLSITSAESDREDPESSALTADMLDELGEHAAADAWLADAVRRKPGNMLAAAAEVTVRYRRGETDKAVDQALALIPRRAEEHHEFWRHAAMTGCLAASDASRTPQMRRALVDAGVLPRDWSPSSFAAWVGPNASVPVRVRQLAAIWPCVFSADAADAALRGQMSETFAQVLGENWQSQPEWQPLAAKLRGEHEAIVHDIMAAVNVSPGGLALRESSARLLGVADDPRLTAYFAEQRARLAQARSTLPQALAAAHVGLMPPGP